MDIELGIQNVARPVNFSTHESAHHGLVRQYSSRTVATHAAHGRIVVS